MSYFDMNNLGSSSKLTAAVIQGAQLLNLYNAEIASILGLKCADIVEILNSERMIDPETSQGTKALAFIVLFNLLDEYHHSNQELMSNWLRRKQDGLLDTPLSIIVDQDDLELIVNYLR